MIVQVLVADALAMSVRIVSPAKDARVRDVLGKEVAEPVCVVCRSPGPIAMAIQAMDGNNAVNC